MIACWSRSGYGWRVDVVLFLWRLASMLFECLFRMEGGFVLGYRSIGIGLLLWHGV